MPSHQQCISMDDRQYSGNTKYRVPHTNGNACSKVINWNEFEKNVFVAFIYEVLRSTVGKSRNCVTH